MAENNYPKFAYAGVRKCDSVAVSRMSGGLNYDMEVVRKSVRNLYKKNSEVNYYKQDIYCRLSTEDNMPKEMRIDRQY